MAEFSTAYLHSMHTAKLGFKPLADFFCANLDRTRQIWLVGWRGLNGQEYQEYMKCSGSAVPSWLTAVPPNPFIERTSPLMSNVCH